MESLGFSWILRPFARLVLWRLYKLLADRNMLGLITGSRIALDMWLGVRDKKWSFLSPPGLLRDKGELLTLRDLSWSWVWRG